jgi:hypothetical protein
MIHASADDSSTKASIIDSEALVRKLLQYV